MVLLDLALSVASEVGPGELLSQVFDGGGTAIEGVVLENNSLGFLADTNAGFLFSGGSAFEADIFDDDILCVDIDPDVEFVPAGIANDAVFDFIAMSAAKFGVLVPKQEG